MGWRAAAAHGHALARCLWARQGRQEGAVDGGEGRARRAVEHVVEGGRRHVAQADAQPGREDPGQVVAAGELLCSVSNYLFDTCTVICNTVTVASINKSQCRNRITVQDSFSLSRRRQ